MFQAKLNNLAQVLGAITIAYFSLSCPASQILAPLSSSGGISLNPTPASYVITPAPGNYPTLVQSPNELYYNETVNTTAGGTGNFNGGTANPTEYFVRLDVLNNTGVPWFGYNVTTYGSFQNPRLNQHQSVYLFDYTPAPFVSQLSGTVSSPDDNLLEFRNILVPHGSSVRFEFELALPVIGAGGWYIDQYPITVPEPVSAALLGTGLCGLGRFARRRQPNTKRGQDPLIVRPHDSI